jgi:UDP-glucose 4-epimerase
MAKSTRVLVTGGLGYIGSYLVERLASGGLEVVVLDRAAVEDSTVHYRVRYLHGDITKEEDVDKAVKGVDQVVHLAALRDITESVGKPTEYNRVNVGGTLNLLKSCPSSVRRFVFVSSSAVYGEPEMLPIRETEGLHPLNPYGETKAAGEELCQEYAQHFGADLVVLRLFNVYGPSQSHQVNPGVVSEFLNRVRDGERPVIFGDGSQVRDFIYISDVVEYLVRSLTMGEAGVYNIASGVGTTILDLAKMTLRILGMGKVTPIFEPPRSGEIVRSVADTSKAKREFQYIPNWSLEMGLRRTVGR